MQSNISIFWRWKISFAYNCQTKTHLIGNESIDFNKDGAAKLVSINSSKGVMKIFLDINNKKVESENKSESNYYLVRFKDIEVKDEFQEFSYK